MGLNDDIKQLTFIEKLETDNWDGEESAVRIKSRTSIGRLGQMAKLYGYRKCIGRSTTEVYSEIG